jgi:hypothetical protein
MGSLSVNWTDIWDLPSHSMHPMTQNGIQGCRRDTTGKGMSSGQGESRGPKWLRTAESGEYRPSPNPLEHSHPMANSGWVAHGGHMREDAHTPDYIRCYANSIDRYPNHRYVKELIVCCCVGHQLRGSSSPGSPTSIRISHARFSTGERQTSNTITSLLSSCLARRPQHLYGGQYRE